MLITLLVLALFLIAYLQDGFALTTSNANINSLEKLHSATQGDNWDYSSFDDSNDDSYDDGVSFSSFVSAILNPILGAEPWNFTKYNGQYMYDPCSTTKPWGGLYCDCTNAPPCSILVINLGAVGLRGSLPPDVGAFDQLVQLQLGVNNITGPIPQEIGNLTNLKVLDLSANNFTGEIPAAMGNLINLTTLYLYDNRMTGSLEDAALGNLVNMESLKMGLSADYSDDGSFGTFSSFFSLSLIPSWLNNMTSLVELDLISCSLYGLIPSRLFNLKNLTNLSLNTNSITGRLPREIGLLTKLVTLDIGTNNITGRLPHEIGLLTKLKSLDLSSNNFNDSIPGEVISNMSALTTLKLDHNRFTGKIPHEIFELNSLNALFLMSNSLTGTLPSNIGNLTTLSVLYLYQNSIEGDIPDSFYNLFYLDEFDVSENRMTGELSPAIGNGSLSNIALHSNSFSGQIPESLFQSTMLEFLELNDNSFVGKMPRDMRNMTYLQTFSISRNSLSGSLPAGLEKLIFLGEFQASGCHLTGQIPEDLWKLGANGLYLLDLGDNQLSGQLPSYLGNLTTLVQLNLDSNSLSGRIPSGVQDLVDLNILSLQKNRFTGPIPVGLSKLTLLSLLQLNDNQFYSETPGFWGFIDPDRQPGLSVFDISSNSFTGHIDSRVFDLKSITKLSLGANCLSGPIPLNICSAQNLEVLGLGDMSGGSQCITKIWEGTVFSNIFDGFVLNHYMEGSIYDCVFTGLPNLKTLVLSGNGFTADLPSEISSNLEVFLASQNQISGQLPENLGSTNLKILDLSSNMIQGTLDAFKHWDMSVSTTILLYNNHISGDVPSTLFNIDHVDMLDGNLLNCDASKASLPISDPSRAKYLCGSNDMNQLCWQFVGALVLLILLWLWTKWIFTSCYEEQKQWLAPFEDVLEFSILRDQLKKYQSVVEYGKTLGKLKIFIAKIGIFISVLFSIVYLSLYDNRTLDHTYTYVATAAYMMGTVSTTVLLIFFLVFALVLRYLVETDTDIPDLNEEKKAVGKGIAEDNRKKDGIETNENNEINETGSSWYMPLLRVTLIFILINMISLSTHVGYFTVLKVGTSEQIGAYIQGLSIFNLVFDIFALPWIMTNKLLLFGVCKEVHMEFINRIFGSELYLVFLISTISSFWIPIFTASTLETSCLNGIFQVPPDQTVTYTYTECNVYFQAYCKNYIHEISSFTITKPYVYGYGCSSALLKAYIPVFMSQYFIKCMSHIGQYIYLCLYTKYQNVIESDNRFIGSILAWPRLNFFQEAVLLVPYDEREVNSTRNFSVSDGYGKGQDNEMVFDHIFIVCHHLNTLLIMFTFGVFAPILALEMAVTMWFGVHINQLVLGRRLVVEAGIATMYEKRIQNAENYTVKVNSQGTFVRLMPGTSSSSHRLRVLSPGSTVFVDISNAEKVDGMVYVKLVGEYGWVPLLAIEKKTVEIITVESKESKESDAKLDDPVPHSSLSRPLSGRQYEYDKRLLNRLGSFKVTHAEGTFVRLEPSSRSKRLRTLRHGDEINVDLSDKRTEENNKLTFVRIFNSPGWVVLEAMEQMSEIKEDSLPALMTDYPLPLPLWLHSHTVDMMENMIRNAESPWGAVSFLRQFDKDCQSLPHSIESQGIRTFLYVFFSMAAFVLNDTYNSMPHIQRSYWAPIAVACFAIALDVFTIVRSRYFAPSTPAPTTIKDAVKTNRESSAPALTTIRNPMKANANSTDEKKDTNKEFEFDL